MILNIKYQNEKTQVPNENDGQWLDFNSLFQYIISFFFPVHMISCYTIEGSPLPSHRFHPPLLRFEPETSKVVFQILSHWVVSLGTQYIISSNINTCFKIYLYKKISSQVQIRNTYRLLLIWFQRKVLNKFKP